jgi:hypothetical protein
LAHPLCLLQHYCSSIAPCRQYLPLQMHCNRTRCCTTLVLLPLFVASPIYLLLCLLCAAGLCGSAAPFKLIRALSPLFRDAAKAEQEASGAASPRAIINISSTSGTHGNSGQVRPMPPSAAPQAWAAVCIILSLLLCIV